jgi:predicted metal-dependent peptidase
MAQATPAAEDTFVFRTHIPMPARVTPTPAQRKAWVETKTVLLWSAPTFANVFFSMMAENRTGQAGDEVYWTNEIPIAATDDATMFLNPETFCKYALEERVFICAHEIMHAILNHCGQLHHFKSRGKITYLDGTTLPMDFGVMSQAMDYIINDALHVGGIGKMPKDALHDTKLATHMESVPTVYKRVYQDQEQGGKGKGTSGGKGFDEHLSPGTGQGKDPSDAQGDRNETEWKMAVAAGVNAARVQGKLPAGLQKFFEDILKPQVDWSEHVRMLFGRKVGNSRSSWDYLDEQLVVRGIGAPGRVGHGADTVVVGYDSSGSLYSTESLQKLMSEVAGIIDEVRPKRLVLIQCDMVVQDVRDCADSDELQQVEVKGGGATDFRPVFDKIDEEFDGQIDCLVYLTDGYGCFPAGAPNYPVIWGNVSKPGEINYPFGDVVDIPQDATNT